MSSLTMHRVPIKQVDHITLRTCIQPKSNRPLIGTKYSMGANLLAITQDSLRSFQTHNFVFEYRYTTWIIRLDVWCINIWVSSGSWRTPFWVISLLTVDTWSQRHHLVSSIVLHCLLTLVALWSEGAFVTSTWKSRVFSRQNPIETVVLMNSKQAISEHKVRFLLGFVTMVNIPPVHWLLTAQNPLRMANISFRPKYLGSSHKLKL